MSIKHSSHNGLLGRVVNITMSCVFVALVFLAYFSAILDGQAMNFI